MCISKNQPEKKSFNKISAYIYAVNLNENHTFKKISREKCVNFADFRRIKCIFTQPIAKKDASFADFQQSKHTFMQPIAKRGVSFANFRQYDCICAQPVVKKKKKK